MSDPVGPPAFLREGPAARVLALLDHDGEAARVVGGAVRNHLAGEAPGDVDIATTALPDVVMRRARAAGLKAVPTGLDHGTITVIAGGVGVEVTTLREDVATDGRHASVRFGRDFDKDAARRDFTINAMAYARDGRLFDPFGGREDLRAGRVRFIGAAEARIREDYLRILRLFRFHARYGRGSIDADAFAAVIATRAGLDRLSRERIGQEMRKLLAAPGAPEALAMMAEAGLVAAIVAGVTSAPTLQRLRDIEAGLGVDPDPIRRLGALAVLVREDAERLAERLRLSNGEFRRLDGIGHGWKAIDPDRGEAAAKIALYEAGPRGYRDRALVAFARSGAPIDDAGWRGLVGLPERWKAPAFAVTGDMLAARGLAPGPAMGAALRAVRAAWMAADFPTDPARVAALVEAALADAEA